MKAILILSDQSAHALLTASAINKYTDGNLVAYAEHRAVAQDVRDFLIAAGLVDAESLPRLHPARFDEIVHVRPAGTRPQPDEAGRRIARRMQLPALDYPAQLFEVYSELATELRNHYRLNLPPWTHPRDQWIQEVVIGGPWGFHLPKECIRFRGHRVSEISIRPPRPALEGDSLTLYALEAGGYVILHRHSKEYLPEEGYSYFLDAGRADGADDNGMDDGETAFNPQERLRQAIEAGPGIPFSGAQIREQYPEFLPVLARRGLELDERQPASRDWCADRAIVRPRFRADIVDA